MRQIAILSLKLVVLTVFLAGCNLAQTGPAPGSGVISVITQTPGSAVNGIADSPFSVPELSDAVAAKVHAIVAVGQAQQNRVRVFSKVGDSITVSRSFMVGFSGNDYDLAQFDYLQPVVDFYRIETARTANSFANVSLAAGEGWAAWAVLNGSMTNPDHCESGEIPLVCEYRIVRPAVAIIMFGTNDAGYRTGGQFRSDLTQIAAISMDMGVVPLLTTIPNRPDVSDQVTRFNDIIRDLAQELNLPLIDYNALLQSLPNQGLLWDDVHPSTPPLGSTGAAIFTEANLQYGYTIRNLATLQALYALQAFVNP